MPENNSKNSAKNNGGLPDQIEDEFFLKLTI